jgi:uncharacterized protein
VQSHDFSHIRRVVALALSLAAEEQCDQETVEVIHIAALLHDVKDWKYCGDEQAGKQYACSLLEQLSYAPDKIQRVVSVIESVGFKDELSSNSARELSTESCIVQDADRLDAIGAIGIARTFTFGGARSRTLYSGEDLTRTPGSTTELTSAEYKSQSNRSTMQHFSDKLFKLKSLMKTKSGVTRATERHQFMIEFVSQFQKEVLGDA